MTKRHSILAAAAGLALGATLPAGAQTYTADDLLLNFRNASSPTSGNDLEVDVGSVSALVTTALGSAGQTISVASSSLVTGVLGTPSGSAAIGFSASAGDPTSSTIWLTRVDTTPGTAPTTVSEQQNGNAQASTVSKITLIGMGYAAGTPISGYANATTVAAGTSLNGPSYQSEGEQSASSTSTINFNSSQSTAGGNGGVIESKQTGAGTVYEALWEVPVSGSDTYEGYFTFNTSGGVNFTAATPEPSTYAMFAATGLLGLVFRRKLRTLLA